MKKKKLVKKIRRAATFGKGGYPDKSLLALADSIENKGEFKKEKKSDGI